MDDDLEPRDEWLALRLKAAAQDAYTAPRRRLPLAEPAPQSRLAWMRAHRLIVGLVALNAATGAAVVALGLSLSTRGGSTPAPTPTAAAAAPGAIAGSLALDLPLYSDPFNSTPIVVAFGAVWIPDTAAGTVLRVDERTLQVVARVPVDRAGAGPTGIGSDGRSLWATANASSSVVRIDPATNRVADTIAAGAMPQALAVSGGTVWVTTTPGLKPGTLIEIDTAQRRVVRTYPVGAHAWHISVAANAVWVANSADTTATRVDLARGGVTTSAPNEGDYDVGYVGIAADATGAWVLDNNRAVVERVDGPTMIAGRAVGVGLATVGGGGPTGLAVDGGFAWVASEGQLVRVDLSAGTAASLDLTGARSVATGDGAVWVLAGHDTSAHLVKVTPAG